MPEPAPSTVANDVANGVRDLIEDPGACEAGLTCIDAGLELAADLTVAAVCRDAETRPVLVLTGSGDTASVLGRALRVLAEVRRVRGLLERLYRDHGMSFDRPRVWVVARRLPDEMFRALAPLQGLGIEGREVREARLATPTGSPVMGQPHEAAAGSGDRAPASSPAPRAAARPPATPSTPPSGAVNLVDEAKKKILRISDEIEEEVDGDLVRFLVHDRVLAVLATVGGEFSLYVGDQPDRRRSIQDRDDLNRSLDDVFRRFFSLSRAINGSTGPR